MNLTVMAETDEIGHIVVKPSDTIKTVKEKIATELGPTLFPVDRQKLVHDGRMLSDNETVADAKFVEGQIITVSISKAPPVVSSPRTPLEPPTKPPTKGGEEQ